MQLQRRYHLPNCTLVLDGLPDSANTSFEASQRLSILLNAECHLAGHDPFISGGRVFFTDLVTSVSHYAQQCLSGVPGPEPTASSLVRLTRTGDDRHQMQISPEDHDGTPSRYPGLANALRTLDLTTVQLFDLVEAIDQFFADPLALPNFTLALRPVSKRAIAPVEPLAQRVLTPALGVVTLAAAGIMLFNLPIPKVETPRELLPEGQTSSAPDTPGAGVNGDGEGTESPTAEGAETTAPESETPESETPDSETLDPATLDPATLATVAAEALTTALDQSPVIGDRQQLSQITATLFDRLNSTWADMDKPTFSESLLYRLGVSADGNILGYRNENAAARTYVDETPLLDLLYLPAPGAPVPTEPLAEFRVVFTPSGKLEVSPWHGYPPEGEVLASPTPQAQPTPQGQPRVTPSPSATPQPSPRPQAQTPRGTSGTLITSGDTLGDMTQSLYQSLDKAWDQSPTFSDRLTYQVTVNAKGEILDYKAVTVGADRFGSELPLTDLEQADADNSSFGIFRVVFTPSGVLEVSPWDGTE
ncbi:DUF4335 domain-containing protein [Prochlorothrix hollandica]|uniref:DUF4335 domain-containing protein n=1 Tax=Prochlorothrix hollandica PCC 9006 = CALU 1027 TaxID=317619 RepID=A0A0M2PR41_PROHO|nr:DUF4335 domain-containing protein [Prochlorothrix hollandica]KKI98699.1 hypothetical protein PROH_17805 [Prochlorothrix hollandica PCC 9006 = CALU 1027]